MMTCLYTIYRNAESVGGLQFISTLKYKVWELVYNLTLPICSCSRYGSKGMQTQKTVRKTKDIRRFCSSTRRAVAKSFCISNDNRKQIMISLSCVYTGQRMGNKNKFKEMSINKNKHAKI